MTANVPMMPGRRPRVLMLLPGPLFDIEEFLRVRLETISGEFEGAVVTFAERAERATMGDFQVVALPFRSGRRIRSMAEMARAALALEGDSSPRFDIVTTYDATKTGLVGWYLARKLGARLIVEVNGDCFAWANYSEIRNPVRRVVERATFIGLTALVLRRADGIKVLHPGQLERLDRFTRRAVVRHFPNFVDLSFFTNVGEEHTVLVVGFPYRVKGIDLLIEAFKRVASEFTDWNLHIVGYFPDSSELLRAIDGHPRIALLPPVSRREVAGYIGRCGIFALPSRTEGMGRVLMEAAACGKPRIGAAVGGIPRVISNDVDGLLCPPEDVDALTAALRRLMADPALRARLGAEAARRATREFSASAYEAQLRDLYDSVLRDAATVLDRESSPGLV